MRARVLRRLGAAAIVSSAFLLTMLGLVPTATAAATCARVGGVVTITFGAAGDSATIVRSGTAIFVNGAQCADATVNNTTSIDVTGVNTGGESVTVDLSGGPFLVGGTGVVEIDIDAGNLGGQPGDTLTIVGSSSTTSLGACLGAAGDDEISLEDQAGAPATDGEGDLNGDFDFADLLWDGVSILNVNSGAGDDTVDASGYTVSKVSVNGGDGDDWILGTEAATADTLAGGAGDDTVDYSALSAAVVVNLQGTQTGTSGAVTDQLSGFENVDGTDFADVLTGDENDNWITPDPGGVAGNDVVTGGAGDDTVDYWNAPAGVTVDLTLGSQNTGGAGLDTLSGLESVYGSAFADTLKGGAGDNVFGDGSGAMNDTFDGGAGFDIVDYWDTTTAIAVDLSAVAPIAQVTGGAGSDKLTAIEGVWGGEGADTFKGDSGDNEFDGGYSCPAVADTVDYSGAAAGVTIDLTGEFAEGDGADGLYGIENAIGSAFNDTLEGTYGATAAEANNVLNGGGGTDTVSYSQAATGVSVSLAAQTTPPTAQATGGGGSDTLSNFENVAGSTFNDTLTGDGNNNVLIGWTGDDVLNGGAGTDTADYAAAPAAVFVDLTFGTATGGDGADALSAIENITGSAFDDELAGDGGNNRLDGGDGVDTVSYKYSGTAVRIDLQSGIATGAGSDLLFGFENVRGSDLADTINGDTLANLIRGAAGNDSIGGRDGDDDIRGNAGNDSISGAAGDDTLKGNKGNDSLNGGAGNNTCNGGPGTDTLRNC